VGNLLGGEVVSHGEKEEPCLDDLLSMRGAAFHRWVTAEKEKNALRAYERLRAVKEATLEERVAVSRKLLEVGRASEAVSILNERTQGAEESIELRLLRSTAYAAAGDYVNAIAQCDAALKREPKNLRVKMRMAELQKEATR
jgi:thioredoxin-like negative regulator of GroEL